MRFLVIGLVRLRLLMFGNVRDADSTCFGDFRLALAIWEVAAPTCSEISRGCAKPKMPRRLGSRAFFLLQLALLLYPTPRARVIEYRQQKNSERMYKAATAKGLRAHVPKRAASWHFRVEDCPGITG